MRTLKANAIIHIFASVHVIATLVCRLSGIDDSLPLTILTMAMTILICFKRGLQIQIYSEEKNTIIDFSLDILSEELEPKTFFRISRSCIINIQAIESIVKNFGSRLKICAIPEPDFEMTVSRSRIDDFMVWLEGGKQ